MTTEIEIPKQFDFKSNESKISSLWEKSDIYRASVDEKKKAFCVVIPPPNVTGILHMGHVLDNVPQDVMTRWHRMRGFSALWIPGTDHAGIATQSVVSKKLLKEGVDPKSLGREKFLKYVWEWKEKHGHIIISQLKKLGCSCDWTRERFTMDEGCSEAVLTAFVDFFNKGLIYRGKRMINWCTVCGTALADDEVEHETVSSHLWHLRYPLAAPVGDLTHLIVATTRPETMLGDTAIAVHPDDDRYKKLVGGSVVLPLQGRAIPIIADEFVDPAFGTGAVKVTPAHDPNDYRMGQTHKLQFEVVIGDDGKMTKAAGKFAGLERQEARKRVVAELEAQGVLEKIEPHSHAVGQCYRCRSVVEPLVSDQWFVKMRPLAEKAAQAVRDGRIEIVPESEKHDYFHWMNTIQDWCISRQLWWGHRIPVYYCGDCNAQLASVTAPTSCTKCGSSKLTQDEDVLDTWFSSQLWPFATLGWPKKTPELSYWFPNTWLMSGRDILFFWDARMIMAALELLGEVPFRTLALHGLVRDEHGRKLSKSLGNSPDPLQLFETHGTDAVRAAIALHYPMGRQDTRLGDHVYRKGEALITKLWNACRLMLLNLAGQPLTFDSSKLGEFIEDRWIVSQLGNAVIQHDSYLAKSDFTHALESVSNFFWNEYCDWYLEIIKGRLRDQGSSRESALATAMHVQRTLLKLFHPYIPFVTEELWQIFRSQGVQDGAASDEAVLALARWPERASLPEVPEIDAAMSMMTSLVRGVRDVRHHLTLPPKSVMDVRLVFIEEQGSSTFAKVQPIAATLGFLGKVEVLKEKSPQKGTIPVKFEGGVAYVVLPAEVNVADVLAKVDQKLAKLTKGYEGHLQRMNNPSFVQNAPPKLIEETKAQMAELKDGIEKLQEFKQGM